jgi:hypothetical protein
VFSIWWNYETIRGDRVHGVVREWLASTRCLGSWKQFYYSGNLNGPIEFQPWYWFYVGLHA